MKYAKRIVLHCPISVTDDLETLVENFIRDGVSFVGVVGPNSSHIEDLIDEIVVGDDSRERLLTGEFEGDVQLVELAP